MTIDVRAEPGDELRRRRRQRVAAEIEKAALRLFVERGFDAVTVDDIAAEVDISRRTFFRYFPSKDDVVLGERNRRAEQLRAAIAARPADEPPALAVRNAMIEMASHYEADREVFLLRAKLVKRTPEAFNRGFGQHAATIQSAASALAARMGVDLADDFTPQVLVAAAFSSLHVAVKTWLERGARDDLEELATRALDVLSDGLALRRRRA